MDKGWSKIIAITGAVGVLALLFSLLMNHLFGSEIVTLLGSEKTFYIIILLISVFFIALILAILKPKKENQPSDSKLAATKVTTVTYQNSKHDGDNHF